ncbi:MAG: TIGR02281 family clan AA aspartic protease [Rhizobiales bacterium]|nr:TIGR02281 family clan AA aspartic protease [Hyphomicrobiales bacterium]
MIIRVILLFFAGALAFWYFNSDTVSFSDLSGDKIASLVFYGILGLVVTSGLFYAYRHRFGKALRDMAIWALLLIVLVVGYGFRYELQYVADQTLAVLLPGYVAEDISADGSISVTLRQRNDRHFVANAKINGTEIQMLVDTGASLVTLSARDAAAAGFEIGADDYVIPVSTANGQTMAAPVRLRSIAVGSIVFSGVRALVAQPGALNGSLLGNSFLERLVSYKVEGDRLIMNSHR